MTRYPWEEIAPEGSNGDYIARLVAPDFNPKARRLYWSRSWSGRPALLVEYECEPWHPKPLPLFKNLQISDYPEDCCLAIELLDRDMSELFYKVCLDIIGALQDALPSSTRKTCVLRLERWSAFLRPSRGRLSPEVQKGLIAELRFLHRDALEAHSPDVALEAWVGPERAPRDFAFGQKFVEVKSKRGSANPYIVIASEDQLNVGQSESVFLFVEEINSAPSDDNSAVTVSDVVNEARSVFTSPLIRAELDSKLGLVGYFDEDDYSDFRWSEGSSYYYEVVSDFPRIESRSCVPGVSSVSYQIDLDYCVDYQIERVKLINTLR